MASQALYRRYRSQTFTELVGQEHIVQTLRNALGEGRIAHAYLFTGPRGVGKTSTARLLAKAVNCAAPQADRPCGVCESCLAVAEGRHVDVIEMDAASHTSVEDAREIIERVQFRPSLGTYKVYVIDEVHMLSTAAFNALLKTLEEPPAHALFILATTEVHKVPATILSRCQQFVFNRHTVASTSAHLHEVATAEGFVLETGVAEALARAATGSMRDALSVMDQLMSYGSPTISLAQVQSLLGASESREVTALVVALIGGEISTALHAIGDVTAQGVDLRQFARDLVKHLRDLLLLKAGGDADLIDVGDDELAELQQQAQAAELGALVQWVRLFGTIDLQIRTSVIPQLPLEMAVVEALARPAAPIAAAARTGVPQPRAAEARPATPTLAAPRPAPTHSAEPPAPPVSVSVVTPMVPPHTSAPTVAAPLAVENWDAPVTTQAAPAIGAILPPAVEQPAAVVTAPDVAPTLIDADSDEIAEANAVVAALEQLEAIWPKIVQDVRVRDKMVYALLNSGVRPVDIEGSVVALEVASDFFLTKLNQQSTQETIELMLKKHTGIEYRIRSVVKEQHRENANLLREQIRTSRKDPHVKAAINIFDAEIIAVETDDA